VEPAECPNKSSNSRATQETNLLILLSLTEILKAANRAGGTAKVVFAVKVKLSSRGQIRISPKGILDPKL